MKITDFRKRVDDWCSRSKIQPTTGGVYPDLMRFQMERNELVKTGLREIKQGNYGPAWAKEILRMFE